MANVAESCAVYPQQRKSKSAYAGTYVIATGDYTTTQDSTCHNRAEWDVVLIVSNNKSRDDQTTDNKADNFREKLTGAIIDSPTPDGIANLGEPIEIGETVLTDTGATFELRAHVTAYVKR